MSRQSPRGDVMRSTDTHPARASEYAFPWRVRIVLAPHTVEPSAYALAVEIRVVDRAQVVGHVLFSPGLLDTQRRLVEVAVLSPVFPPRDATAMLDLVPDLRRGTSTCPVLRR